MVYKGRLPEVKPAVAPPKFLSLGMSEVDSATPPAAALSILPWSPAVAPTAVENTGLLDGSNSAAKDQGLPSGTFLRRP